MRSFALAVCGIISVLAMSAGVLLGIFLILSPSGGGFFPDLGFAMGLLALGTGNLLSSICNGIYWWLGKRPRWLGIVTLMQSLPALLFAGLITFEMAHLS
jgi:hypothetical protein